MKKQIVSVSPVQAGKIAAVVYFIITIPFVILYGVTMAVTGSHTVWIYLAPILYAVFGFLFTALAALIYNFAAGLIGGLEFTVKELDAV